MLNPCIAKEIDKQSFLELWNLRYSYPKEVGEAVFNYYMDLADDYGQCIDVDVCLNCYALRILVGDDRKSLSEKDLEEAIVYNDEWVLFKAE